MRDKKLDFFSILASAGRLNWGALLLEESWIHMGQDLGDGAARALSLMQEALELLDSSKVPGHIGAHLDLAIAQLEGQLALSEVIPDVEVTLQGPQRVGLRSAG